MKSKNSNKKYYFLFFTVFLYGCASKPFQPAPPDFTMWTKNGASEEVVKKAMLACGYPNVGGFAGVRSAIQEHARAQQCMFKSGFRHKDGSPGICSLPNIRDLRECQ